MLSENQIIPNMLATEKWQAIEEIVSFLIQGGYIQAKDKENVLSVLCQREETMSTGIGFGVAIPHASSNAVQELTVAFGRSQSGIEFESLDDKPVHFIVLFLVPEHQFQTHLKTLSAIAKFFNDRFMRDALVKAPDAAAIMEIFRYGVVPVQEVSVQ
ncbi:MAG: PTS sugar transporter subunit IIA [Chthoniobacterales bacterium]